MNTMPISMIKLVLVLLLTFCSLATTAVARSSMVGRTATIGVLRHLVMFTPVTSTSLAVTSLPPVSIIGTMVVASVACFGISISIIASLLPHLSKNVCKDVDDWSK